MRVGPGWAREGDLLPCWLSLGPLTQSRGGDFRHPRGAPVVKAPSPAMEVRQMPRHRA